MVICIIAAGNNVVCVLVLLQRQRQVLVLPRRARGGGRCRPPLSRRSNEPLLVAVHRLGCGNCRATPIRRAQKQLRDRNEPSSVSTNVVIVDSQSIGRKVSSASRMGGEEAARMMNTSEWPFEAKWKASVERLAVKGRGSTVLCVRSVAVACAASRHESPESRLLGKSFSCPRAFGKVTRPVFAARPQKRTCASIHWL